MKWIKFFEDHQSKHEINKICKKLLNNPWYLNSDGTVDVKMNVILGDQFLDSIPIQFGKVGDYFDCSENKLTPLKGSPYSVGGWFSCSYNKLTTLEFSPKEVGGSFYCYSNNLTSLVGCPKYILGDLSCGKNNIRTFEGIGYIRDKLYCGYNPIYEIWDLISNDYQWDEEHMDLFEDCSIIQDDGEAVAIDRLNFFLEEIGKPTVEKVYGYINI